MNTVSDATMDPSSVVDRLERDEKADQAKSALPKTLFYLGFGSNLSSEVFTGRRGIHPISTRNVFVPSLRLTFDLPGLPYTEPAIGNSAFRDTQLEHDASPSLKSLASHESEDQGVSLDKDEQGLHYSPLKVSRYRKDAWRKPMVGILYELTPKDLAEVMKTEGGGSSYQDIVVDCYELQRGTDTVVPRYPTDEKAIKSHTLLAPHTRTGGRKNRPDTSYAQPSARYLKLLTDGAAEHELPREYQDYLKSIRPYRMTTRRQHIGHFIFRRIWGPLVLYMMQFHNGMADETGRSPDWLNKLKDLLFSFGWISYDWFYRPIFGEGERTIGE